MHLYPRHELGEKDRFQQSIVHHSLEHPQQDPTMHISEFPT